jgi:hypothetical protein
MENENQDIVALLENCVDVDKKGDATPRSKGLHGIYCGEEVEKVHGRSQEGGRLKTALGWRMYETNSGHNRVTRSSVRGMPRPRISCARGETR